MHVTVSSGPIVYKIYGFFSDHIFGVMFNFSKTLLFEFLIVSKTLLFCSFIIFKRTKGTSIPSNYIYFTKTTN